MSTIQLFDWLDGIEKQKSESIEQRNVKGTVQSKAVAAMRREALVLNLHGEFEVSRQERIPTSCNAMEVSSGSALTCHFWW